MVRYLAAVVVVGGCAPTPISVRELPPESRPDPALLVPPDVDEASGETSVPPEILLGIAMAETRLQMITGEVEFEGQSPAFGIMGLRSPMLELGAELAGFDVQQVKTDRRANVLAAAHLLAGAADEAGIDPSDLDAWAPVVARYSGIEDEEGQAEYVHHQVYEALRQGIAVEGYAVAPMTVNPNFPLPLTDLDRATESGTIWTPSPNYNSRSGASVDFVIIHTCEGSYSSCWSWLSNSASGVSAHYVVKENGAEVRALVDENNRAWHISANYDCDNNSGVDCWRDGTSMNTVSVGIEHAGYGSQSSWDPGLLSRSAELTCGITERHDIPRDSYHVVGHGQLQPWNRTDPGPNWPWADYL
ncbi:MAG: N-acetylmuramoyl-L-alanine amidase, partial [Myxococcota bacterium]